MRSLALLALLVACERDPGTTPTPPAPSPPGPRELDLTPPAPPVTLDQPRDQPLAPFVRVQLAPTGLFVNGSLVLAIDAATPTTTITSALTKALPKPTPDSRAIIAADKQMLYGTVIAVMEAIKQAGYAKLAFETTP
jgi:biopolymer transport protein ExbD